MLPRKDIIIYGQIFTRRKFEKGWLQIENRDGKFYVKKGFTPGRTDYYDLKGVFIPPFFDAHTHIGDAALREIISSYNISGTDLNEVVAPPEGIKHRLLKELDDTRLISGMKDYLHSMKMHGIEAFMDFREGGLRGMKMIHEALDISFSPDISLALGRPLNPIEMKNNSIYRNKNLSEVDERFEESVMNILDISTGINVSGMAEWDYSDLLYIRDNLGKDKLFSFHFSEDKREDVEMAIELKPDFVIHGNMMTEDDIIMLKENNIPIVSCPSSSIRFGYKPPFDKFYKHEMKIFIGTDNAMFGEPDMLREIKILKTLYPTIPLEDIIYYSLCYNLTNISGKTLNYECDIEYGFYEEDEIRLNHLECETESPEKSVMNAKNNMININMNNIIYEEN